MQYYIVVKNVNSNPSVCFIGNKPFIGNLGAAEDLANFLYSINSKDTYTVTKLTFTTKKGKKVSKYSENPESNTPIKRRVIPERSDGLPF